MTKPVTNHPNCVRVLIRKIMPVGVWRILFCRPLYKRSIQNMCVMWFSFFVLIILYCLFTGMFMLAKSEEDYPNDRGLHIMVAIVLVSSAYIALVSMALEVVIMLIIMIFMTLAIFLCF